MINKFLTNPLIISLSVIIFSCSGLNPKGKSLSVNTIKGELKPLITVMTPGEAKYINIQLPTKLGKDFSLFCQGEKMTTSIQNNQIRGFIAVPYKYHDQTFQCELKNSEMSLGVVVDAKIKKVKYKTSHIKVPKRKVDLKKSDIDWYLKDKKLLKRAYANLDLENSYFDRSFIVPLESKITSPYGALRIFNNKKSSWHNGVDFRASVGTPIPSANRGKVIMVRHLFFNGKTVLVDHGMNIVSLYCHLSDYNVKVGDIIERGEVIGFGGNTGRSSGPHLHWGMRVQGHWINGLNMVEQSSLISNDGKGHNLF